VRNRVYALYESFYPTKDVPYNAVKMRMATLLGIVDRMSVLAYLGRPRSVQESVMDQTVRYIKSGATVPKRHYFKRKLAAKRGYIEVFGVGYIYIENKEWFVHWSHTEQLTLESSPASPQKRVDDEGLEVNGSKVDFSLSLNKSKGNTHSTRKDECEHGSSRETEKREILY